jgi:hypothetical protein
MTVGGVPQEYTFITFGIKFTQIFPISKNIAFTSKSFEVLNYGLLSSPNLIGSFVGFKTQVDSIDDVASSIDNFFPKMLSMIFQVDHYSSHLLNHPVLSLYNSILLRSNGG